MKTLILIFITFFLVACTGKNLTVKSLQPSQISNKKIHNIILEDFEYDDINQTNYLEEILVNKVVDDKRVFNLQTTYQNIDAIITGKILESSLKHNFYYDEEIDYNRCKRYEYKDNKRTKNCLKYKIRKIPCENRNYNVKTKLQVLDANENILFSKIYTKSKFKNKCYENRFYYNNHHYYKKEKYYINSLLAKQIAIQAVNDISPHYIYQNITIIENLEKNRYKKETNNIFARIVVGNENNCSL